MYSIFFLETCICSYFRVLLGSGVLLNMGVGYLNYIRKKKCVSLSVPQRTVTKQTYIVTVKEYQVCGKRTEIVGKSTKQN